MPQIVIAVVAAIATYALAPAALSTFAAAVFSAVVGAVISGVGNMLVAKMTAPKAPNAPAAFGADRRQTVRSGIAARSVAYGRCPVSGPIVYIGSSGTNNEYIHLVVALTGHVVHSWDQIVVNGNKYISQTQIDGSGNVTAGDMAGVARVRFYDGTQTTADPDLVVESGGEWTADHKLLGISYVYVRLKYDQDRFPNGFTNLHAVVYGKKCYDPRNGTTYWTDNAALCIRDYLVSDYGLACSADEIDEDSFIAAANICDESVTDGTTTHQRYKNDGAFGTDTAPIEIIEGLLSSCSGVLTYVGGKYRLNVGAYTTPTLALTASDFAGEVAVVPKPPTREMFNAVRGKFTDPTRNWQLAEFPPVTSATYEAQDNNERIWEDVDFRFQINAIRAQRLAKIRLLRGRENLMVRGTLKYSAIRIQVWQTVTLTLPDFGFYAKVFRIVSWQFNPESGLITVTMQEDGPEIYGWLSSDAGTPKPIPDTDLPDPMNVPAPTGLAVTGTTFQQADGSTVPGFRVTWNASATPFLSGYEVQWKLSSATDWSSTRVGPTETRAEIRPVQSGATYNVRLRALANLAFSNWVELSGTATGPQDSGAPAAPTSLAAVGTIRAISLTWTLPADKDLAAVEVYENTTSSTSGRAYVGETKGAGFIREGLDTGWTRYYWVRSRDLSGNVSAYVGPVNATTQPIVGPDIQDAILTTAKFASSIRPVAIPAAAGDLAALKQTNQIIFPQSAMTDPVTGQALAAQTLYRWTGSAWVAVVDATEIKGQLTNSQIAALAASKITGQLTDAQLAAIAAAKVTGQLTDAQIADVAAAKLTGQITSTQITDGAISTPKLAAGSVSTAKLAAGAVTADTIAANAVTSAKILAGSIGTSQLAAGAVIAENIAAGAITATKIQAGAVETAAIAAGAIDTLRLAANAVTADKIAANAVTADELAANAVTAGKIAAGAVSATEIAAGAIVADKLAANAVTAAKIQAGTITANEIEVEGITKSASAIGSNYYGTVGSYNDVASYTFSCTSGAKRVILVSVECSDESSAGVPNTDSADWQTYLRMKIGGTVQSGEVDTVCKYGTTTAITWSFLDTTSRSGSVAFVLQGKAANFPGATRTVTGFRDPTLTVLEFKR